MIRAIEFKFYVEKTGRVSDWETAKKECDRLSLLSMPGFIPMQYTGMDCDNGEKIHDGEFVCGTYREGNGPEQISFPSIALVQWDKKNGKWIVECGDDTFDLYDFEPMEYIGGNMYENPELLKP